MTYTVAEGVTIARHFTQPTFQDLNLAANVHEQAADETVAANVDERSGCQTDELMDVREAEHQHGRVTVVRQPSPVRQVALPELREK